MNTIEKVFRHFADITVSVFGHTYSNDADTAGAPLWSVICIALIGVALFCLVVTAGYVLVFGK